MKRIRIYTGADNESHLEELPLAFTEREGSRTALEGAVSVQFIRRPAGQFIDFHPAPARPQYVVYLTASIEIGLGDGTTVVMEPGDVLQAEDSTGHGHTSRTLIEGVCAFVPLSGEPVADGGAA